MLLFPGLTNPFSGLVFKWAMGHPGLFFVYFRSFHTNITIFNTNILGKNVHPVSSAGIRTHDLLNASHLP